MKKCFRCKICGKKCLKINSLARHIQSKHYGIKKYYDKYIKEDNEGRCVVCGNKTTFVSMSYGYRTHCCASCSNRDPNTIKKQKATLYKNFRVYNPSQSPIVQETIRKNSLKKNGVDSPNKVEAKKKASFKTKKERYGDGNYNNRKKAFKTNEKRFGYYSYSKTKEFKKNISKIQRKNAKSRMAKTRKTNLKRYNCIAPSQNPIIYNKIFNDSKRSGAELKFEKLLKKNKLEFKSEYFIKKENIWQHHFDFALFKNNKLKCLVELDGEYYHGLLNDCDGYHSLGNNDYLRWKLVPNKVKFLVIDSQRLDEGFKELKRILPMKYKDWKKEMLRSIPKNIEEAIPKFGEKRMLGDWKKLCSYRTLYKGSNLCKSILLHFCHSHWKVFDWKSVRKTLYKSPVSSHHLLEGLDSFKNISKLREKFRKKYKGIKEVIVKHHSPEKMLAICSLGKTYISKEPIDKESKRIIKFLKLKVYSKEDIK